MFGHSLASIHFRVWALDTVELLQSSITRQRSRSLKALATCWASGAPVQLMYKLSKIYSFIFLKKKHDG